MQTNDYFEGFAAKFARGFQWTTDESFDRSVKVHKKRIP